MSNVIQFNRLQQQEIKIHTCPIVKASYIGQCPNVNCTANISHTAKKSSGCYLHVGKHNVVDVARWLSISTTETKKRYKHGMKLFDKFIQFYYFLQKIRDFDTKKPQARECARCGVINKGNCLNIKRCQRRQKLFAKAKTQFPLNLVGLDVTQAEFWQLVIAQSNNKIHIFDPHLVFIANKRLSRLEGITNA